MKRSILLISAMIGLGILLTGGFIAGVEYTNTLGFCISCHEMKSTAYEDYRHTAHFTNGSGVQAICSDCHVPKAWGPKLVAKIRASKDVWHWLLGTINTDEKFEARRLEMATRVWTFLKQTDSGTCRSCHNFDQIDWSKQARFAARIHREAIEDKKTCIDCHKGITHRLPKEEKPADEAAENNLDMEYAEEINMTCTPCHGEFGQGKADGTYPRLAGLDAAYIAAQLRNFKSKTRLNIPMFPFATERELPEEDVRIIAAYLANIKLPSKLPPVNEKTFNALNRLQNATQVLNVARYPGNFIAGGRLYAKECAGCHGKKGEGDIPRLVPPLTGQHSGYLKRQIKKFSSKKRRHDSPKDAAIFKSFGDGELGNILAWLSVQDDD